MVGNKLTLAILAAAMAASACAQSVDTGSTDLPAAPAIRDVRDALPVVADDGLLRVIVSIPETTDTADNATSQDDPIVIGEIESDGSSNPLLGEELAGLPAGSTLVQRDGVLGYVDDDDLFVRLGTGADNETPQFSFDDQADVIELLNSISGVESVLAITETTYAATATSVEGITALGLDVHEDAALALSADPYVPYQWALENNGDNFSGVVLAQPPSQSPDADVDGSEAQDGATGRGIVVAVIDAGVDFGHPDLSHARWSNSKEVCTGSSVGVDDDGNGYVDDCVGWDFGDEDATPFDGTNDEHGTHVAGIIAARSDNNIGVAGIAPNVQIMDLKVSNRSGAISSSSIARAIRYAADNGADVVNLSLGTQPGASLASVAVIEDAVNYAGSAGVLLVAAAGNSSVSLDQAAVYPASFDAAHLLTVGASTPSDRRASFSNTGSAIDLFAPGDLILSTIPGGDVAFMSGTSQAAPIAAATAALMLERNSALSPTAVIDEMVRTGDRLDSLDGLAANPVRLNSARTLGIEADLPGEGDAVTIRGLDSDVDGLVTAQISIGELGGQFNQKFHWEASLLTLVDGEPFAVTGHPVTIQDIEAGELLSTQTDQRGSVSLAEKGASSAGWSTTLPDGSYALLIEAIPRTDPTVRLGDGFLARFDVGQTSSSDTGTNTDGSTGTGTDPEDSGSTGAADTTPGTPTDGSPQTGANIDDAPDAQDFTPGDSSDEPGASSGGSGSGSDPGGLGSEGTPGEAAEDVAEDAGAGAPGNGTDGTDSGAGNADGTGNPGSEGPATDGAANVDAQGADNDGSGDGSDLGTNDLGPNDLGPDEVADGPWSISGVTPRTGPVNSAHLVVIDGTFPDDVVVWFGDGASETVFQSDVSIMVETPLYAVAETVDISLRTRDGNVLVLPDGYAFVDTDEGSLGDGGGVSEATGSQGDNGDTSVGSDGSTDSDGSSGGTNTDPSNGDGSTPTDGTAGENNGSPGAADEPTFDDDPDDVVGVGDAPDVEDGEVAKDTNDTKSRNRQARANTIGEARVLPNGLTGVPLSGLDTIGGMPKCDEALCRTRRI